MDYGWNNINVSQPTRKTMTPELKKDLLFASLGFRMGVMHACSGRTLKLIESEK